MSRKPLPSQGPLTRHLVDDYGLLNPKATALTLGADLDARIYHVVTEDDKAYFLKCLPETLVTIAQRKLDMINAATDLNDLKIPPANRLEALKGSLKGFYSIRINDQYRIVFRWADLGAQQVKITDYH